MTVQILKEDAQIKSFDEFLKKYQFREISYEEFKMLTEKRRPLRKHEGIKLYGYRMDSRLTGIAMRYFFLAGTKAYIATLASGSTNILFEDLKVLWSAQNVHVIP